MSEVTVTDVAVTKELELGPLPLDLPDPELVAQFVQVVPTADIVRAVYDAIKQAQQHQRENWRKHPQEETQQ